MIPHIPDDGDSSCHWLVAFLPEIPMWTVTPQFVNREWEVRDLWPAVPDHHWIIEAPNEAFALMYAQSEHQEVTSGR